MPELTPDQLAALLKLQSNQQFEDVAVPIVERKICDVWRIQYSPDGSHWTKLGELADDMREMRAAHKRARDRLAGVRNTVWDKIVNVVIGAIVALGAGWVLKRTGFQIPGTAP